MRGPWHIHVTKKNDNYRAQIVDEEISTEIAGFNSDLQEAISECRDAWSAALFEDFGPQDFVVEYDETITEEKV